MQIGLNYCYGGTGARSQGGARWMNYAKCPSCGKRIAVNKDGRLHAHGTRKQEQKNG